MWDPACYLMNYLVNLKLIFKKINYQNLWMAKKKKKKSGRKKQLFYTDWFLKVSGWLGAGLGKRLDQLPCQSF